MELGPSPILPTTIMFGNVRGIKPGIRDNKLEYINLTAKENNAIMIALTESHLKERISDYEINIDGFSLIRSDRSVNCSICERSSDSI